MDHVFGYFMLRYRRTWRGSIVISFVNPALFLAALGAGLGKLVDHHDSHYLHGASYLAFLAPGLLAAAMMQTGYLESAGPVSSAARPGGIYRAAATTPLAPGDLYLGHLLFITFRLASTAVAFGLVAAAFGAVPLDRVAGLVGAGLLTGLAFAAPVAAWAITVDRFAQLTAAFRFVIMPMYMFSGTFFSPDQLPGWLHAIVACTPLYHGAQLCREVALGSGTALAALGHAGYLLVLALAGLAVGVRSYPRVLAR